MSFENEIHLLGNPSSPHLREWLRILPREKEVTVWCIESRGECPKVDFRIIPLPKFFSRVPSPLRYAILGVLLRKNLPVGQFVHAHNASGYGLAAYISDRPYILTTYGSEIFHRATKGFVYRKMLRSILTKASLITTTTEKMVEELVHGVGISGEKIKNFSLGVSDEFSGGIDGARVLSSPITFISNRRSLPLYHTLEIIAAFRKFQESCSSARLIVLQGDASSSYSDQVRTLANSTPNVSFIEGFQSQEQVKALLDQSHYQISVPDSDQLSSAILEGMSRGVVPILRPLKAYSILAENAQFTNETHPLEQSLLDAFHSVYNLHEGWTGYSELARQRIREDFSRSFAICQYRGLLQEMSGKNPK